MKNAPLDLLESLVELSQAPLGTFRDIRMAGLQFLFDFALSKGETKRSLNTLDLTEFFRLGEPFAVGHKLAQEVICPTIDVNLRERGDFVPRFLKVLESYQRVLSGKEDCEYVNLIKLYSGKIDSDASYLLEGSYMKSSKTPRFDGKKVLVTGSETGIGRGIALEFVRRGAKVALHYPYERFSRGALSAVDLITESGGEAKAFEGDFRDSKKVRSFWNNTVDYLGGIDVLVNNAGVTIKKPLSETTTDQIDELYSINVKATHHLIQISSPYMVEQKRGAIVNLASSCGFLGLAGHSVYGGTKGAIISLTRHVAMELAPHNIRVNAIAPDGVAMQNAFRHIPGYNTRGENYPLGYMINPEDVANLATFLASDDAKCITGQTILIDCGATCGIKDGIGATKIESLPFGRGYISGI